MTEPFVFINTYPIKEGRAGDYEKACHEVAEAARANQRLLHVGIYINEEGTEATTVQIHPDADSMGAHMQIVGEHIRKAQEFVDFSTMRVQIYGTLNDAVLEQMRQLTGAGVPVAVRAQSAGFNRLPAL